MTELGEGGPGLGIELQGAASRKSGERQAARLKQAKETPEAHARTEVEESLGAVAPPSEQLTGTRQLRQVVLGAGIAVEHRALGAFLHIQHELQGHSCSFRPLGIGRITAVAL